MDKNKISCLNWGFSLIFSKFKAHPRNVAIFFFYRSENCKSLDNRERPKPVESSKMFTDLIDFGDFLDFMDFMSIWRIPDLTGFS